MAINNTLQTAYPLLYPIGDDGQLVVKNVLYPELDIAEKVNDISQPTLEKSLPKSPAIVPIVPVVETTSSIIDQVLDSTGNIADRAKDTMASLASQW